jgi:hypothetical protein
LSLAWFSGATTGDELGVLFQHGFGRFRGGVFAAGQRVHGGQAGQFVHDEQHVFQGCLIRHLFLQYLQNSASLRT